MNWPNVCRNCKPLHCLRRKTVRTASARLAMFTFTDLFPRRPCVLLFTFRFHDTSPLICLALLADWSRHSSHGDLARQVEENILLKANQKRHLNKLSLEDGESNGTDVMRPEHDLFINTFVRAGLFTTKFIAAKDSAKAKGKYQNLVWP